MTSIFRQITFFHLVKSPHHTHITKLTLVNKLIKLI